jgi:hypothetical protein
MMRSLAIASLILLGTASSARAQAGPRAGGPAPGDFSGTNLAADLSLAGSLARGVADRDLVTTRGLVSLWSGRWGVFVQPYYLYGDVKLAPTAPRVATDDERYLRTAVFHSFSDPLFEFGVAVLDHSLRRRVGRRALVGGGVGATLHNRDGITVVTSFGIMAELAHYDSNTLPDMAVAPAFGRDAARESLRIYGRYRLVGGRLVLVHDVYIMPNVQDAVDLRVLGSGVLEIPISWGFAARIQIDASYEQFIVRGTQHDDVAITFGAAYKTDWKLR